MDTCAAPHNLVTCQGEKHHMRSPKHTQLCIPTCCTGTVTAWTGTRLLVELDWGKDVLPGPARGCDASGWTYNTLWFWLAVLFPLFCSHSSPHSHKVLFVPYVFFFFFFFPPNWHLFGFKIHSVPSWLLFNLAGGHYPLSVVAYALSGSLGCLNSCSYLNSIVVQAIELCEHPCKDKSRNYLNIPSDSSNTH